MIREILFPSVAVSTILCLAYMKVPGNHIITTKRKILAIFSLYILRLLSYFFSMGIQFEWLRNCIRFLLPSILYLYIGKACSFKQSLYFTMLTWIAFSAASNVFGIPRVDSIFYSYSNIAYHVLGFILVMIITRMIPIHKIYTIPISRFGMLIMIAMCEFYIEYTKSTVRNELPPKAKSILFMYLFIMQLFIIGMLILFEKFIISNEQTRLNEISDIASMYRSQAAETKQAANENVIKVHHDMKNHLLAIGSMLKNEGDASSYIKSILNSFDDFESLFQTGNAMLDGLLTEKYNLAQKSNIDFIADIKYSPCCNFIEDVDTCAIFGNAIDNAIEACMKLKNYKFIKVQGKELLDNYIIRISNSYSGQINMQGDRPITTKIGAGIHGIGISSIKNSANKYGGSVVLDLDVPFVFTLSIIIPLSSQK